jgi:cytoskeletal protein CcmA (bactofilin family)
MSVFTRSDKTTDPNAGAKATAQPLTPAKPETPVSIQPEPIRPVQPANYSAQQGQGTSIISKALKITGQLESTEAVQIDGEVDGDIRAASVKVGSNAKVKGTVYGEVVELAGRVEGKIEAKKVVLTHTAHMSGDIVHQDITIESGAYMNGHCRPDYGKTDAKAETTSSTTSSYKPYAAT